jgi:hypothetical protein
MPMDLPEFSGEGDPRAILIQFVREVQKFLAELVQSNTGPRGESLFHEQLLSPMRAAWAEVQAHFPEVAGRIRDLPDHQIINHGLGGQQLRFKLAVIRWFYGQYLSVGKGVLKKLIDIIDDLLKSIVEASGFGGAIVEIKDFIKDSVEE